MSVIRIIAALLIFAGTSASAEVGGTNSDRVAFARVRLLETALAQSSAMSPDWDPGQRDCAGLVRFLFRQATAGPAEIWKDRLGARVPFVSAGELIGYNFGKTSERFDPLTAQTGDVLVFHRPDRKPEDAWHLMVLLKPPAFAKQDWLAIYHNGDRGLKGQVRIVTLNDLLTTVHGEWRPNLANSSFRGVYRWNEWLTSKETR